jgi:hypothetical protein
MKIKNLDRFLKMEETGSLNVKKDIKGKKPKTEDWGKTTKKIVEKRRYRTQ